MNSEILLLKATLAELEDSQKVLLRETEEQHQIINQLSEEQKLLNDANQLYQETTKQLLELLEGYNCQVIIDPTDGSLEVYPGANHDLKD